MFSIIKIAILTNTYSWQQCSVLFWGACQTIREWRTTFTWIMASWAKLNSNNWKVLYLTYTRTIAQNCIIDFSRFFTSCTDRVGSTAGAFRGTKLTFFSILIVLSITLALSWNIIESSFRRTCEAGTTITAAFTVEPAFLTLLIDSIIIVALKTDTESSLRISDSELEWIAGRTSFNRLTSLTWMMAVSTCVILCATLEVSTHLAHASELGQFPQLGGIALCTFCCRVDAFLALGITRGTFKFSNIIKGWVTNTKIRCTHSPGRWAGCTRPTWRTSGTRVVTGFAFLITAIVEESIHTGTITHILDSCRWAC